MGALRYLRGCSIVLGCARGAAWRARRSHGQLGAVDAPGLGCDFLVAECHKWLFGPRGTGLFWGRDAAWDQVTGTVPSFDRRAIGAWIGGRTPRGSGSRSPSLPGAALFEPGGFHAFEHRWALAEAFGFHLEIGKAAVAERTRALATRLKDGLAAIPAVRLVTPRAPELSAGIVCLDVGDRRPGAAAALRRQGILASVTPYVTPTCGSARAS